MFLLQNVYAAILNFTYKFTQKIDEKWRNIVIEACLHVFALMSVVYASAPESEARSLLGIVLIAIIIVMSVNRPLEKLKTNIPISIAWIIFSVFIAFSFFDPLSQNRLACISLVIIPFALPAFYYVWSNRGDFETFTMFLCRAFANIISAYNILLIFIAPYQPFSSGENYYLTYRYIGTTTHSNHLGALMVAGFITCLYIIVHCKRWLYMIPYSLGLCLCTAYIYFSASRTSLLNLLICLMLALFYFVLRFKNKKHLVRILLVTALTAVSLVFAYGYANLASRIPADTVINNSSTTIIQSEGAASSNESGLNTEPSSTDVPAVPQTTMPSSINETILGRYNFSNISTNKLDYILSNRLTIWKVYLQHISIRPEYASEETLRQELNLPYYPVNAHNSYIYHAYLYGLFAGLGELLIAFVAIAYSAIYMFRKKTASAGMFFCIIATCAFFLTAMMEYIGLPLNRALVVIFYFSLSPIFNEHPSIFPLKLKKEKTDMS